MGRQLLLTAVVVCWSAFLSTVEGNILCECTTYDCEYEGKRTCEAEHYCYVENIRHKITRGCTNDRTPLLCENRRPSKLANGEYDWPLMFCCREDFCNSDVIPAKPTEKVKEPEVKPEEEVEDNPYVKVIPNDRTPCPNTNSDSSRLNPIYIAVPVAGVCVLLALIIFAMYLLRRRNDLYTNYETYAYHEQVANLKQKQLDTKNCNGTLNRCTDSERSSQGSETKLFLNA